MTHLKGPEAASAHVDVLTDPNELLALHEQPILVEYQVARGEVTARLGTNLTIDDSGRIIARSTATPSSDKEWSVPRNGTIALPTDRVKPVYGIGHAGVTKHEATSGSFSLLRDAEDQGDLLTPARATNGMLDATKSTLSPEDQRHFENITNGLIEINGMIFTQPTTDQAVVVRGNRGMSIHLGGHFEAFGPNGQVAVWSKESLSWNSDADPRSYDHWQRSGKGDIDRGQFVDHAGMGPYSGVGVKVLGTVNKHSQYESSLEMRVIDIENLMEGDQIASPHELFRA